MAHIANDRGRRYRGLLLQAFALVAATICATAGPAAQLPSPWTLLPGQVVDVSINDAAQAYAVSTTGEALRWRAADQRWSKMTGKFVRITGAEGNHPWGVTEQGVVMRFNGLWWEIKGTKVADVAGDAVGNVFIAGTDGRIQKWEPLSGNWRTMTGQAARIALDDAGAPWVVAPDARIYRFSDGKWQAMPGRARDIAVGSDGTAIIADAEGAVRAWRNAEQQWAAMPGIGGVIAVATTPNGGAWAVRDDGSLHATVLIRRDDVVADVPDQAPQPLAPQVQAPGIFAPSVVAPGIQVNPVTASAPRAETSQAPETQATTPSASSVTAGGNAGASQGGPSKSVSPSGGGGGSGDAASRTAQEELVFTDTRGTAARIEIGKDGSVFALITGGTLKRWSNERNRFEDFPGQLVRLSVDNSGNPWGITGLGRVFRHNGQTWKQIFGTTASDIAIGGDGTVVTADAESALARYNPTSGRFDRIGGRGLQVAIAPDGTPWTIRSDNVVQRCDVDPCKTVGQLARNISIGPDGSVFLVSTNDQLLRKRPGSDNFVRVLVPGHVPDDVAVGPQGFPWVVTNAGKVLSTKYFERDEAGDRTLALKTSSDTSGTGATAAVVASENSSAFKFTKNLKFDGFKSSDPDANFGFFNGLAVGQDDSVFIHNNSDVFEFNSRKEKFEALDTTFPASIADVSTDADGIIWGLSSSAPATVYRIKGSQVKSYTVISTSSSDTPRNMAVDGDGTIYAAVGSKLYRKLPSSSTFKEFSDDSIRYVTLAAGGDIWILNNSFIVQQWTGSKFENRPKGTGQSGVDIAGGADGTIYIADSNNNLMKWNAANAQFDDINTTLDFDQVGVTSEGRPWGADTSTSGENIYRAKD